MGTAERPRTGLFKPPHCGNHGAAPEGVGQENVKIILTMPLIVPTGGEVAGRVVAVVGPGRVPSSAAEAVGSTKTQFFMHSAWRSKLEDSFHAGN